MELNKDFTNIIKKINNVNNNTQYYNSFKRIIKAKIKILKLIQNTLTKTDAISLPEIIKNYIIDNNIYTTASEVFKRNPYEIDVSMEEEEINQQHHDLMIIDEMVNENIENNLIIGENAAMVMENIHNNLIENAPIIIDIIDTKDIPLPVDNNFKAIENPVGHIFNKSLVLDKDVNIKLNQERAQQLLNLITSYAGTLHGQNCVEKKNKKTQQTNREIKRYHFT